MQTPPIPLLSHAAASSVDASTTSATTETLSSDPFAAIFARLIQAQVQSPTNPGASKLASVLAGVTTTKTADGGTSATTTDPTLVGIDPSADLPTDPFTARNLNELVAEILTLQGSPTNHTDTKVDTTSDQSTTTPSTDAASTLSTLLAELTATAPSRESLGVTDTGREQKLSSFRRLFVTTTDLKSVATGKTTEPNASVSADSNGSVTTDPNAQSADGLAQQLSDSLQPSTVGSTVTKPRRLLQPFQVAPLVNPRVVDDSKKTTSLTDSLTADGLALSQPTSLIPENIFGNGKGGRIAVNKDVLQTIDKLIRRPVKSDIIERGASILTPDELKPEAATVEDRNATALARVDRGEFVDRVLQALQRAQSQQPKTIEIELNPPSLGKLRVTVTDQDGQLSAKIEVHSSSARAMLLDNLPVLDRQLGEHGVQIQRFQVDQMNTAPSASSDLAGGLAQQQKQPGDQSSERRAFYRSNDSTTGEETEGEQGSGLSIADILRLADGMDRLV